jgi:uncharacterized protein (TIGR00725 family)
MRVCVIGGGRVDGEDRDRAAAVGHELAERGHEIVCGGLGGVMEAACRGAKRADAGPPANDDGTGEVPGRTIGVLPGDDPADANRFVDVPIATGMGNARNALVAANGDAAIAIDGAYGTLSEIALALDRGIPVATLASHDVEGVDPVTSAAAAVRTIEERAEG